MGPDETHFSLSAVALALPCWRYPAAAVKKPQKKRAAARQASVLTRNNVTEPQSLDPHQITGVPEINVVRDLFEGLVETDAQGKNRACRGRTVGEQR